MLKRIAIMALLGTLGLAVGYASTWLGGHRYYIGTTLWLPRNSPHSAKDLVVMTSGHHPGAQVRADGQEVNIEATGTILGADHAMRVAYKEVVAANDRKFRFLPYYAHFADQLELTWGDPVHRGLVGLLAGISAALGFLVPPRSRLVRCPSCSGVVSLATSGHSTAAGQHEHRSWQADSRTTDLPSWGFALTALRFPYMVLVGRQPVAAGPGDQIGAGAGGRRHLRASRADREQVIAVLKAAFVQGRLAKDEFDLRVGQVLASRTYADMAVLTADIPAGPTA
jgi:hypothetical protein